MVSSSFVDSVPLWAFNLISLAVVLLSVEFGWRLGSYQHQSSKEEDTSPITKVVEPIMGLLALLLAFTFSMSASRFESRKQAVIQEANAIGTTYLRTNLLAEQSRTESRRLLSEYLALRAGGAASIMTPEGMAKSAALQDQLWAIAATEGERSSSYTTGLFIQSLNEMIDLDTVRLAANRNRIPDSIWFALCVVTIFAMVTVGDGSGLTGRRHWTVMILLAVIFTTVIMLIADLDRPQAGFLRVSQQPLIDLLNRIGAPPP
jgi:hypothetical protein